MYRKLAERSQSGDLWIAWPLWTDASLSLTQRAILAEIESQGETKATNGYFCSLFGVSTNTVTTAISVLRERGLVELVRYDGSIRVLRSLASKFYENVEGDGTPDAIVGRRGPTRHLSAGRDKRLALLKRHGGRCEACGKQDHPFAMHLHHKDGAVEGGRDRKGERKEQKEHPERFVLLCTCCHGKAHRGDPVYKGRVKANA